jgi:hypothetical protein
VRNVCKRQRNLRSGPAQKGGVLMADAQDVVILLHIPRGNYADLARVYPDFPSRAAACAYLERVGRPQDYRVSAMASGKPVYLRGDRFLAQSTPKRRQPQARSRPIRK